MKSDILAYVLIAFILIICIYMYTDTDSFLYLYPSEFDITYYTREGENRHIHRHTSCVLTELNISYAPQGNFNVFANGMPTQINITLSFKELAIPTKESIKDQGL